MVYRASEVALAGAVSAATGDVEAMISAAELFWIAPATSAHADELDDTTWATLVKAQAGKAAIAALLGLAQEKKVRYRSFLHLVQNLHLLRSTKEPSARLHSSEVKILVDLLPRVREDDRLTEHWAAILVRLTEGGATVEVRKHLEEHHEALRLNDEKWAIVALLLATTNILFVRVDQWLADWESRNSVPMFLVSLYLNRAAQADSPGADAEMRASIASRALQTLEPDGSEHYLRCIVIGDLLRTRRQQAFLSALDETEDLFEQVDQERPLGHPLGQALNRYKTRYQLVDADFDYYEPDTAIAAIKPLVGLESFEMRRGQTNQRIVNRCRDLGGYEFVASQCFLKVRELLQIDKKSPRFKHLAREFRKLRKPIELPWINREWDRLFRMHAPLRTRVALTLFS